MSDTINTEEQDFDYDVTIDSKAFIKETLKFKIMQWINIKDKKPQFDKRVLVSPEKGNVSINMLVEDSQYGVVWQDEDGYMWKYNTVHRWMPLPEKHIE